jgi:hypothetical protein
MRPLANRISPQPVDSDRGKNQRKHRERARHSTENRSLPPCRSNSVSMLSNRVTSTSASTRATPLRSAEASTRLARSINDIPAIGVCQYASHTSASLRVDPA